MPAYPPRHNRNLRRLQAIFADAQATLALTTDSILADVRSRGEATAELGEVRWLATPIADGGLADAWREPAIDGDTLAFLQYTSGSTAVPKGVMVSHANLLYNERMIQLAYGHSAETVFAGWLPLYHDMGLIGNVLQPVFLGIPSILMPPVAFLQKPLRWLQAISRYRATTSGGPDFAYRLCVQRIPPAERAQLDLSSWSVAFNGAEPVRAETLEEFADAFATCGFRREAFCPCYGLAEATLLAAGGARAALPAIHSVSAEALGQNRAVDAADDPCARRLVGCGTTWLEQQIAVVDPESLTRCPPERVGEIWLAGPNVAGGYWRRSEETERTFAARLAGTGEGPFLRTGDLGFLRGGELVVTGRLKDLIILRGVNHYPQDVERTAEASHPALAPGANAAFSVEIDGEERLVLVQELRRDQRRTGVEEVARAIRQAVAEEHEALVHTVVLIQPGSIAKTSSGKIQRHANRAAFLAGELSEIGRSVHAAEAGEPAPPASLAPNIVGEESFIRRALRTVSAEPERRALLLLYLQEQVARVLRVPAARVEAGVPLSALGLDSLIAIELQNQIGAGIGVALPAAHLLAGPTLGELAAEVLALLDAAPAAPGLVPAGEAGELQPLSYGQRALWSVYQREPESSAYNIALAVRLRGELDVPALRRALQALVDRHPALRTTFEASAHGEAAARVHAHQDVPVVEEDARGWTAAALAERLAAAAHRPFDLQHDPLLRFELCRCAGEEHVLLLVVHHIVIDLWSLGIVLRELGELYQAQKHRREAALRALRFCYSDYVRWQAESLEGPDGDRLWEYWRGQLGGDLPLLDLPLDRPRPPVQTCNGATRPQRLGAALGEDLAALCRQHRTTLFMTLLAAFQVLLHRYASQESVVVGSPMAGRHRAELADLVGYFVNPVVLRGDLAGDPPFAAFLGQIRGIVQGAFEHQELPFALLVERLQPARDASRSPIFQVVLVLQKTLFFEAAGAAALALGEEGVPIEWGGLALEPTPLARPVVPFDLTLSLAEAAGPLLASWQYNSDLFDAATVARMAGHFEALLAGLARDPGLHLSELPLLSDAERHQLVMELAAEPPPVDGAACLHHSFEEQARRAPGAVAASLEEVGLTYLELNRRANQLAHHLRALGVGPEVLVGVCLEPTLDLVVALLGILKAGGAYLPLDPDYPAERLRFMTENAGAPVVVTEDRLRDRFAEGGAALVRLDADAGAIARRSAESPASGAVAANAAYVIYTSGSTGRPKGVVVSHRNVLRLFRATAAWFRFSASDVWTLFHSCSFDFSVWELWGALLHGGRVVVVPRWLSRAPDAFHALLAREGVTVLNQTPSAFYQLMRAESALDATEALSLRWVVFGGEALDVKRLAPWIERHGDCGPRLVNMYGITETTVHVTYRPLDAEDLRRPGSPIGVPIPDLQARVVDRWLRPVPLGVPGELAVGGEGLARGYLGRPRLTAGRFVPDPFNPRPGARLYRSGDLVRRRADGELEYLGRIDQQVKVRGFRVELGEIEAVLRRHPAVRDAVVVARDDGSGDRLVAYVVTGDGHAPIDELRGHLWQTLPEYMIPALFVPLGALPLSPSGKVDRRALPEPEPARPELSHARLAPRNRTEEQLAAIWSEVLGVAEVGVTDNFFSLGGDSILSIQVVARAHQLGYRLTPRQAFEHQTIAELAAVAEEAAAQEGGAAELGTGAPDGSYTLTPLQQGLLFHSVYEPDFDAYLVQVLCVLAGPLDAALLEDAWRRAAGRHPVLRTSFRWQGRDEAVQVVHPAVELPWRHEDWRPLPPAEREERLAGLLAADRQSGFDLAAAPLLRLALLRLTDELHQLVVTFHHLILDGWSTAALLKEVLTGYAALRAGRTPEPPPAPPFRDYLAWLARQDAAGAEAFWRRLLHGFTAPTPLPDDRPPGAGDGGVSPGERRLALTPEATTGLGAFSRHHRVTQSTLVQGAWGLLLARHAGEPDVVFGATVAGRPAELPGVESMLGLLINTLPVRVPAAAAQPLLPWLGALQGQLVEMRQHEHSALNAVQAWSAVPRGHSLFDSIVTVESYPLDRSLLGRHGELAVRDVRSVERTHYPLSIVVLPGDALALHVLFDRRRFDDVTVQRLLGHLERVLTGFAAAGEAALDRRLGDVALLTEAQEHQLLREWNGIHLLDGELRPVPIGGVGALYAGEPGEVLHKTGERARRRADGTLVLVSRVDPAAEEARPAIESPPEVPCGEVEIRLAEIWSGVLKVEPVGRDDNFFELGGDSILSLQVTARAHQAGLRFTPKQLFECQTIGELAEVVEIVEPAEPAGSGLVTGEMPLTPIQEWFFGLDLPRPEHWNQAVLLAVAPGDGAPGPDPRVWQQAIAALVRHHDALRFAFPPAEEGRRRARAAAIAEVPFVFCDLTSLPAAAQGPAVASAAAQAQASLDLAGPLLRAIYFDLGEGRPARLLLAIHHLVVDGVSWRLLLEDLTTVCQQLRQGAAPRLPPKESSFKEWAEQLALYAASPAVEPEIGHWLAIAAPEGSALPLDFDPADRAAANTEGDAGVVRTALDEDETRALLQEVPPVYRTEINDALLTALLRAFAAWTGSPALLLDLEGHGREALFEQIDVSRTVGWFTTIFPVVLTLPPDEEPGAALRAVKEQLRAVPGRGIGYGLLRYLRQDPALRQQLERLPRAEVAFNYLGQLDQVLAAGSGFTLAPEPAGPTRDPGGARAHLLEVEGRVSGGRLEIEWLYSRRLHRAGTIARLAEAYLAELRALIEHCRSRRPRGAVEPMSVDPRELADEDAYPLTAMQEGMLFHSLRNPESGVYFEQVACTLAGELDTAAFVRAWQRVVDRHPILRTAFVWEGCDEPFQVVARQVELPWEHHDWRGLPPAEQERRFAGLVEADRERGFHLARAPLSRQTLVRTADDRHRLMWSCHHLLLDGWSRTLAIQEVMTLYRALCEGREEPLEPGRPYGEYVAWLRRQSLESAESFWRRYLDGFTAPAQLEGAPPKGHASEREAVLPAAATAALQSFAQRHRLTLNTLVQGAWALVLHRSSGREEVVFGVTVSGRPAELPGVEAMQGLFVNTLPLRTALPATGRTLPWLSELRRQQVEISQFEHTPLPAVQRWSQVPAGQPLFESILAFESYPMDETLFDWRPRLRVHDVQTLSRTNYPLTVIALPGPRLTLRIAYDEGRFDAAAVQRMVGHLETALVHLAADPEGLLCAVPLLAEAERHQLVVEWRDTVTAYPRDQCLHQLFAEQAARAPEAVAVISEETRLTYGELERRANRMAHLLRSLGVGPETGVGLFLDRSPEMVVAILGILKAGGTYVPLDSAYPEALLAFMLDDAGVAVLLTSTGKLSRLPERRPRTVCLDALDAELARQGDGPVEGAAEPESLAYVMYTSGSTGRPKGVAVSHRSVARLVRGNTFARLAADEVFLQLAPISFDASTLEIWGSLANGGRLVLMPSEKPTIEEIGLALARHQVTILWLTAGLFHLIVDERIADLRPLRQLLAGGDVLLPALVEKVRRELPGLRLINGYGPTEGTTFTCCAQLSELPSRAEERVPIGPPICNTWVTVLDRWQGSPMAVSLPGELAIGGDGLARGYLGRPELTAERFIPDPFAVRPGERLYRTGDLVRFRGDGSVEFLGRIDHQVKIRGFRVELGEIEAALAAHPDVREAVVLVRSGAAGNKRLVAYVVGPEDRAPEPDQLLDGLRRQLPEYMIPAAVVVLDAMPLSANGKIDRAALTAPGSVRPEPAGGLVAPRTPAEACLAEIWCQVLGLPQVSVEDDFFALGGDSILSIRLVARARQAGIELTPGQIFEHPTIAALAAAVGSPAPLPAAEPEEAAGEVPLTPIERWFFAQRRADPHHFNMSLLLRVAAELGASVLRPAVAAVIRHHDALHLRFVPEGAEWCQVSGTPDESSWSHVDLSALPTEVERRAVEQAAAPLQASLDLAAGPLVRPVFFDRGAGRTGRLLLVVHHLVVDAVSWRILLEDLATACGQGLRGEAIVLPPRTTSFRHWARRLAEHARTPAVAAELPVWLAVHEDRCRLPLDETGGANTEGSAATVARVLDEAATERLLRQAPRAYRMRLDEVLLTALAQTLAAWTGPGVWRVDLERHGRQPFAADLDLSRTVGWFTSLFPVELELAGDEDPGRALKTVKEALRRVPENGLGWGLLSAFGEGSEAERLRRLPAAEVSFNYLGQLDEALPDGLPLAPVEEPCGPLRSPRGARQHLLDVSASIANGRLQVGWTYSTARHRAATIERVADTFLAALRTLIVHCLAPDAGGYTPSDFPLASLDQETLDRLLAGQRRVEDLYPLSPLQQGLLFHSLAQPSRGEYVIQFTCRFDRPLDAGRFRHAWEQVVARQPVLRTAFHWQGLMAPLQSVAAVVDLPWQELDWREVPAEERAERLAAWLEEDRRSGFDLRRAPLLRLTLLRLGDGASQLVWSLHHVLVDGWSLSLLLKEVAAVYATPALRLAASRPYRDYIAWLQRQDLHQAEAYWRELLAGFTTPTPVGLEWRGGEPRPQVLERALPVAVTAELDALARRHRLTLSTLVEGAWGLLLGRLSGEPEVVFGVTVSGRSAALEGFESMVGLFVNTLPVRLRLPSEQPAFPWLDELQRQQLELQRLEYSPLAAVQKWSDVPAGQELFKSTMVFENYPVDAAVYAAAESLGSREAGSIERTHYALNLIALPGPALRLRIGYDGRRFERTAVLRMIDQLVCLMTGLAPGKRLGELPWLGAAEVQQVLAEWNDTRGPAPRDACLHQIFERQAGLTPDIAAAEFRGERVSYAELDARANQLARHLRRLGVGAEDLVAISLERSLDVPLAILGTLKAGAAYLPLDPEYPPERLAFMLQDARPAVVLTQERLRGRLPAGSAGAVVCLDSDWTAVARQAATSPAVPVCGENLGYVIYTSGSTGRPKGVMLRHHGACNLAEALAAEMKVPAGCRHLQFSSLNFDASVWEIFLAWRAGGTAVLIGADEALPGPGLVRLLREREIHQLILPPSVLAASPLAELPALRTVVAGGEACPAELVAQWAPGRRFWNAYGPTEGSVCVTVAACRAGGGPPAIGRPLANTRVYLVDRELSPRPAGVPGELVIGGHGLARGYLRRPALTAERFVPDPFAGEPGGRLYRTGDLARHCDDGTIEFLGRVDRQVKVRGFRIELSEIEAALGEHPGVREAVVASREERPGEARLVAYLVASGEAVPGAGELRAFLKQRLPDFMVPALFVPLAELPLLPNRKVDRQALPAPENLRPDLGQAFVEPRTDVERQLAAVWADILKVERVGRGDNFFELGGDSILTIQVVARAEEAGLRLTPRQLFDHPTLAELAAAAAALDETRGAPREAAGEVPLSPIQSWFFELGLPRPEHFNMALLLTVHPGLETGVLAAAARAVAGHHDALRLRFTRLDTGAWRQELAAEDAPLSLFEIDLAALPPAARPAAIEAASAQLDGSLDLARGPLLRMAFFRLGRAVAGRLLIILHHLVMDAVSWAVLIQDLATACEQLRGGATVVLPPNAVSFPRWSRRLAEHARSGALDGEVELWLAASRAWVDPLPVDELGGTNDEASSRSHVVTLPADETAVLLDEALRPYRLRIDEMLLTGLALALSEWTGSSTVLIDLESHGREEIFPDLLPSRTVGWLTALAPVLLELPREGGEDAALREIKERLRQMPHRGLGYGLLRYLGDPAVMRKLRAQPAPEVSFNYLGRLGQALPEPSLFGLAPEAIASGRSPLALRTHVLVVNCSIAGGELRIEINYSAGLHRAATIEHLAGRFREHLRALTAHCRSVAAGRFTPSDFPLAGLDQQKVDKIVARFSKKRSERT